MKKELHKSKRSFDYLPYQPYVAINEVWNDADLDYVNDELKYWFYMALSCTKSIYEFKDERAAFIKFYDELLYLVDSIFFLNESKNEGNERVLADIPDQVDDILPEANLPLISEEQIEDPLYLIKRFCGHFPLTYARIELWHFFESVYMYEGPYKEDINADNICNFYLNLLTLVEAAYIIGKSK